MHLWDPKPCSEVRSLNILTIKGSSVPFLKNEFCLIISPILQFGFLILLEKWIFPGVMGCSCIMFDITSWCFSMTCAVCLPPAALQAAQHIYARVQSEEWPGINHHIGMFVEISVHVIFWPGTYIFILYYW